MPLPPYRFGREPPHSHRYLCSAVLRILRGHKVRTVLDIGCGNGILAKELAGQGMAVTGMDPSESGIENARNLLPDARFYCLEIGADPAQIQEADFDAVVSTEVIEHLLLPRQLLRLASAKLRPGGLLLLTTPYHGYLKNLALSLFNRWDSHHAPQWDGGHVKFWSRRTLTALLQSENFQVEGFAGLGRVPGLWKSMALIARKPG